MFRRHVDFFAVFAITLGLLAVSQLSAFRLPALRLPMDSIRVENVSVQINARQLCNRIASRIVYILSH